MTTVKKVINKDGERVFPLTHFRAVRDDQGNNLEFILREFNEVLASGYMYAGIAIPTTNPGTPASKCFYIAKEQGTYTNFNSLELTSGINILKFDGTTWSTEQVIGIDNVPVYGSQNLVKSGGVYNEVVLCGIYDVTANNEGATFASLSALLSAENLDTLIPSAVRNGGMSIRFSTGSKYVLYRLTADDWSTDTNDWAIADEGVYVENPEFLKVVTDAEGRILYGVKTNGDFVFGVGVPESIKEYVLNNKNDVQNEIDTINLVLPTKVDKITDKGLVDNQYVQELYDGEYIRCIVDSEGKVLCGIKIDGTVYIPFLENQSIDTRITQAISDFTQLIEDFEGNIDDKLAVYDEVFSFLDVVEDDDKTEMAIDSEGKIISYRKKNGVKVERAGIEADSAEIEELTVDSINFSSQSKKEEFIESLDIIDNVADNFFLPPHIYVAVGRTIELYYNQIILNAVKYNIDVRCNVGYALNRKYQIIGTDENIGDYTLTMYVRDDSMMVLAEGQTTIHIVSDVIADSHNVLPLGTSITNNKPWLTELHTLSNMLTCVGRRGTSSYDHEGRSGGSISFYNDKGIQKYDFDDNYKGTGSDAAEFDSNTYYAVGDYCKKQVAASRGGYKTAYFRFTNSHQGAWSDADVYNVSMTNPLYDPNNDRISLNYYKSFQNLNFDVLILEMGANGMNDTPATNPNGAKGLKDLVDNIRLDDATIPIVIVAPMMQSSQNGIGKQGNTDGYHNETDYKFHSDKKHLDYAKVACDLLKDYSNVYFCPMMECHDSEYNFGNTKVAVNPRLTDTTTVFELQPSDSVHPQDSGYMQMADAIFSTICYIFNQQ